MDKEQLLEVIPDLNLKELLQEKLRVEEALQEAIDKIIRESNFPAGIEECSIVVDTIDAGSFGDSKAKIVCSNVEIKIKLLGVDL